MIPADEGKRDYELAQEKYRMIDIVVYAVNRIQPWCEGDTSVEALQLAMSNMVSEVTYMAERNGLMITPRDMTSIRDDYQRWVDATYLGLPWNYKETE